jgi:serine/threonine protein kinase
MAPEMALSAEQGFRLGIIFVIWWYYFGLCRLSGYPFECDIWSVGIIMYMLVEQSFPYDGRTEFDFALKAQKGDVRPLKRKISVKLQKLLYSLLDKVFFLFFNDFYFFFFFLLMKDPSKRPKAIDLLRKPLIKETIKKHGLTIPLCLRVWNKSG